MTIFCSVFTETMAFERVFEIKGQKIDYASKETHSFIEKHLSLLKDQYGVSFTDQMFNGIAVNVSSKSDGKQFQLVAQYNSPLLAPFFKSPPILDYLPESPTAAEKEYVLKMQKDFKEREDYAFSTEYGKWLEDYPYESPNGTFADWSTGIVFTSLDKFRESLYVNKDTNHTINSSTESLFHEVLHIWHSRNPEEVHRFLHLEGGYKDKHERSREICSDYLLASRHLMMNMTACPGFQTDIEVTEKIMSEVKWPTRFGKFSKRRELFFASKRSCKRYYQRIVTYNGDSYCEHFKRAKDYIGDMHSMDSADEYFVILLQLAIFSPEDFAISASEEEKEFARDFYLKNFNLKI
ncbi:MAG: hypothetical protein ACPGJV_04160 [Bacteriovoracaceae bacterium]